MPSPTRSTPLPHEAAEELAKVRRVNQSWIVHGHLRDTAARWLEHLAREDPARLERSCWLALFLTHYRKDIVRDPKPLFYAGLFGFATRTEVEDFLEDHPMTRAIRLLGLGEESGLERLGAPSIDLARGIASEIRAILAQE